MITEPDIKIVIAIRDEITSIKVIGITRFRFLYSTRNLNNTGCKVNEIKTTDRIPINDKTAIERKAGCCAKISTPTPITVVVAERKIDIL